MSHGPSGGGNSLLGVSVALSVLQIVFVASRFYTRRLQRQRYGWDDWVMLFALVCVLNIQNISMLILSSRWGILQRQSSTSSVSIAISSRLSNKANIISVVEVAGLGHHVHDIHHPVQSLILIKKVSCLKTRTPEASSNNQRASGLSNSSTFPLQ
jgi:hypothetical protein